jgi:hypothetical protein
VRTHDRPQPTRQPPSRFRQRCDTAQIGRWFPAAWHLFAQRSARPRTCVAGDYGAR